MILDKESLQRLWNNEIEYDIHRGNETRYVGFLYLKVTHRLKEI